MWLRDNVDYFRRSEVEFRGFPTPSFMIVMGRSAELKGRKREVIQEINREQADLEVLTCDDLASRIDGWRAYLKALLGQTVKR